MKKRLFFIRLNVEEQSIAGPLHAGPFWVHRTQASCAPAPGKPGLSTSTVYSSPSRGCFLGPWVDAAPLLLAAFRGGRAP